MYQNLASPANSTIMRLTNLAILDYSPPETLGVQTKRREC